MSHLVEIPGRPAYFLKVKGEGVDLGRSGGRGNCSKCNVRYERIIIRNNLRKYLMTSNIFLQ